MQLTWHTTDATSVSIDGIGDVPSMGVKTVTPTESTTYHLVARNEAGSADASARVTVNGPVAVGTQSTSMSDAEMSRPTCMTSSSTTTRTISVPTRRPRWPKDASFLVQHPEIKIVIGGYCDERGSDEYNMVLGQNRAQAAKTALVTAGVAADRMRVISYGKEKPFCTESNEECWQLNRRAGFSIDQ